VIEVKERERERERERKEKERKREREKERMARLDRETAYVLHGLSSAATYLG